MSSKPRSTTDTTIDASAPPASSAVAEAEAPAVPRMSELERLQKQEFLSHRFRPGCGFVAPPDSTVDRPRPEPIPVEERPVPTPAFSDLADQSEVIVNREFNWAPSGSPIQLAWKVGSRIKIGNRIGGKVVTAQDLAALEETGCASRPNLIVVRILKAGPIRVGDRCFEDLYGQLVKLPYELAHHAHHAWCRRDPIGGQIAEDVTDLVKHGGIESLPPCPPPSPKYDASGRMIGRKDAERHVRFRWLYPAPDSPVIPRTLEWMIESEAVNRHLVGTGEIVNTDELSADWRSRLEEGMRNRVPVNRFYAVDYGRPVS